MRLNTQPGICNYCWIFLAIPISLLFPFCNQPLTADKAGQNNQITFNDSFSPFKKYEVIEELNKRIKIENYPRTNVVYFTITGSYQKHPEAFSNLMDYVLQNYRYAGVCLGFYPEDPDTVSEQKLKWQIGIRVIPGQPEKIIDSTMTNMSRDPFAIMASKEELGAPLSQLKHTLEPFFIRTLQPFQAVTLITNVESTSRDGLALNAWIILNGYVQTAPTIMEYAMMKTDPLKIPTKIVIPVTKRSSGLSL
jgi:hypothetical protein